MRWVRRHRIVSAALAVLFTALYATAIDDEQPAGSIFVVTLFVVAVIGAIVLTGVLFGLWRRRRFGALRVATAEHEAAGANRAGRSRCD